MPVGLALRMLGTFQVLRDGAPLPLPPSRKTRALLAYLALVDRPQRRERLCELFWDVPDDPKGALRWSLSKLRPLVDTAERTRLCADRATVRLDTEGMAIDAVQLGGLDEAALAARSLDELEALAALAGEGFLDDLALDRCPDFEAWRRANAFAAETRRLALLRALVERHGNDPRRALTFAERWLALTPDDATLVRRVETLRAAVREAAAAPPVSAPPPAPPAATQVRRWLTVLDVDFPLPPEAGEGEPAELGMATMAPLLATAKAVVQAQGGDVLELSEAAVTAVFGARAAMELHAVAACRAALAIQAAAGPATPLRIAVDTGEAIAGPAPDGAGGLVASGPVLRRVRHLAHGLAPMTVALSARAAQEAGGYARLEPLAGADPPLFRLTGLAAARSRWGLRADRRLTAFSGRAPELALLRRNLADAVAGQGRAVLVVGEPGLGKSRLVQELLRVEAAADLTAVEFGALDFDGAVPFALARKLVQALLGLRDGATPREAALALDEALEVLEAAPLGPALRYLLDLPVDDAAWTALAAAERLRAVRRAVHAFLALRARNRPVLAAIEDLHWADTESLRVLTRLVDGAERLPVFLLMTARPEFRPAWSGRAGVRVLRLDPLDFDDAGRMVGHLLGDHASVAHLHRLLVERTDGSPLFIEETVRSLAQSGRIEGVPGAYTAPRPILEIEAPATVQPLIAARIDRLDSTQRQVLQLAAVIGQEVPGALLRTLCDLEAGTCEDALEALQDAAFLVEVVGLAEPDYVFEHALIHGVAYASLLAPERRALHARTLEAMERLYGHRLQPHVERLAEHAHRAGAWEKALVYLVQAADRAFDRSAYLRAAALLERALTALAELVPEPRYLAVRVDVLMRMQTAYVSFGDFATAIERTTEAVDLAERIGDGARLADARLKLAYTLATFGRVDAAIAAADDLLDLARRQGLERHVFEADTAAALAHLMAGEARNARQRLLPHVARFATADRHERYGLLITRSVWHRGSLAQAEAMLGHLHRAERFAAEALAIAAETGRPQDRHAAAQFAVQVAIAKGPDAAALAPFEALAASGLKDQLFPAGPWFLCSLGDAQLLAGRWDTATATLERAKAAATSANMPVIARNAAVLLRCALARSGDAAAAGELRQELDRAPPAWLRVRVLATLATVTPAPERSSEWLEAAADVARAAGLVPDLARVCDDLAALHARDRSERAAEFGEEAARLRAAMADAAGQDALSTLASTPAPTACGDKSDLGGPPRTARRSPTMPPTMTRSLFDAHGGFAAVSRIVLRFYDAVLQSERLAPYFEDVDLARLVDHQTKFLTYLLGGPVDYAPQRLRQAHAHLAIGAADFEEIVGLLGAALDAQGLPPEDRDQVLARIEQLRPLIVKDGRP